MSRHLVSNHNHIIYPNCRWYFATELLFQHIMNDLNVIFVSLHHKNRKDMTKQEAQEKIVILNVALENLNNFKIDTNDIEEANSEIRQLIKALQDTLECAVSAAVATSEF